MYNNDPKCQTIGISDNYCSGRKAPIKNRYQYYSYLGETGRI